MNSLYEKSLIEERDELLDAVKEPARQKSPTNVALYAAIAFANIVFLVLDAISGYTVYRLTGYWYYGALTFLAGFVPLILHEFLFTRAFASRGQRQIAVVGAVVGLLSIIVIGLAAGIITVGAGRIDVQTAETGVIAALVLIASFHGALCAWYFYSDLGIRFQQQAAQAEARARQTGAMIDAGDFILDKTQRSVNRRKEIGAKHGSHAALREVLRQMGLDENGNGIPDFMEIQAKPSLAPSGRVTEADLDLASSINPLAAPYRGCPECGETVPLTYPYCQSCGAKMPALVPVNGKRKVNP